VTYGPIDFLALQFKGNNFKGEILKEVNKLMAAKTIRVIDMVIIYKNAQGAVTVKEIQEPDVDFVAIFDPTKVETQGMIKKGDIDMIAQKLENNSTAGLMLFENLWAIGFKEAVMRADGELLMQERIPHEVVLEAVDSLSLADKS
jgi:flagellar basal body rod protein FlgC